MCCVCLSPDDKTTHLFLSKGDGGEPQNKSDGQQKLEQWLNRSMKIKMSDGRTLIENEEEEPRVLGLAMVPGHHILSIHVDQPQDSQS
ncbi:hypothetical protein BaRGS_00014608 [Batillaria attramentaria]|uniref:Uncharacterized protein n=1 Tax=Batillaria attramentaria TaxID=370345 RepID=A0ABD0L3T6_9CAEN